MYFDEKGPGGPPSPLPTRVPSTPGDMSTMTETKDSSVICGRVSEAEPERERAGRGLGRRGPHGGPPGRFNFSRLLRFRSDVGSSECKGRCPKHAAPVGSVARRRKKVDTPAGGGTEAFLSRPGGLHCVPGPAQPRRLFRVSSAHPSRQQARPTRPSPSSLGPWGRGGRAPP